jgi:hypothetical protein
LTGWWTGDGSGEDLVGNNAAMLSGDTTFRPGLVRRAFTLDGDGDFAAVADSPTLNVGEGDFTVDFWVKFKTTEGEQVMVEDWVQKFDGPSSGWTLTKLDNNVIRLALGSQDGSGGDVDSQPLPLPANRWLHFAARRSGNEFSIFLFGIPIASVEFTDVPMNLDSPSSLKFGHRGNPEDTPGSDDESGFYLNGQIDEVDLVVGRALSTSEIRSIVLAGPAGKCKP